MMTPRPFAPLPARTRETIAATSAAMIAIPIPPESSCIHHGSSCGSGGGVGSGVRKVPGSKPIATVTVSPGRTAAASRYR